MEIKRNEEVKNEVYLEVIQVESSAFSDLDEVARAARVGGIVGSGGAWDQN